MKELTQDDVKELLDYNPETGEILWKHRSRGWFSSDRAYQTWNTKYQGKEAGSIESDKGVEHRVLYINRRKHLAHRLIWIFMTGACPDHVKHKNGNRTDNRWENLYAADSEVSTRTRRIGKNNKSGVKCVWWNKKLQKWQAQVKVHGEPHFLGLFDEDDLESAALAVKNFKDVVYNRKG